MECCDFSAGERSAGSGQAYKTGTEKGAAKGKLGFPPGFRIRTDPHVFALPGSGQKGKEMNE